MIKFNSDLGSFEIPSSFSEMSVKNYLFFLENINDHAEIFQRITSLSVEKILMLNLDPIVPHLEFLKDPILETVEPLRTVSIGEKKYELPEDIGTGQWAQKLLSVDAITEGDYIEILCIYLQPIIDGGAFDTEKTEIVKEVLLNEDADSIFSNVKYVFNQLEAILKNESEKLKANITHEQKLAGIEKFNVFGDFNSIDMIAEGSLLKHEEVVKLEYNLVFLKLYHIKISGIFDKKFSEIMSAKK